MRKEMDYGSITKEMLIQKSRFPLSIVPTDQDLFYRMALDMFDEIAANNKAGKKSVFIVPVGPVGQYRKLAMLVNRYRLSLKNTYIFNMDEYLDDDGNALPADHPLSFKGAMLREFYNLIDDELNVPDSQRFFPTPENVADMYDKMQALGGVDVCFGGIGINGHVAFNEPPEPGDNITDDEFCQLGGRKLAISRETITINSSFSTGGIICAMPKYCVTLGMKEILSSRKIRLYLARGWQQGIIRVALLGPVTCKVPVTLLERHPDTAVTISEAVAEQPVFG